MATITETGLAAVVTAIPVLLATGYFAGGGARTAGRLYDLDIPWRSKAMATVTGLSAVIAVVAETYLLLCAAMGVALGLGTSIVAAIGSSIACVFVANEVTNAARVAWLTAKRREIDGLGTEVTRGREEVQKLNLKAIDQQLTIANQMLWVIARRGDPDLPRPPIPQPDPTGGEAVADELG